MSKDSHKKAQRHEDAKGAEIIRLTAQIATLRDALDAGGRALAEANAERDHAERHLVEVGDQRDRAIAGWDEARNMGVRLFHAFEGAPNADRRTEAVAELLKEARAEFGINPKPCDVCGPNIGHNGDGTGRDRSPAGVEAVEDFDIVEAAKRGAEAAATEEGGQS